MTAAEEATTQQIPTTLRPRRRHYTALVGAIALAAAGTLAVTLSRSGRAVERSLRLDASATTVTATAAPGANDQGTPPASSVTATTRVPTTIAPPTTVAERLTADSRLSLQGVGPVRIGMTLTEASVAAGVPIRLLAMPPGPECRYAAPDRASGTGDELGFMVVDGRIVRIDVGIMGPDRIRTVSGIGKGNTEAEVQATYPGRIQVQPHPYVPHGRYLVYVPSDPGLRHLSLIFETVDGRVTSFRAGLLEPVSWTEGCS